MVEHHLAKVGVASSSLVFRSIAITAGADASAFSVAAMRLKTFLQKNKIGVDGVGQLCYYNTCR